MDFRSPQQPMAGSIRWSKFLPVILLILVFLFSLTGCSLVATLVATENPHLLLGNPSGATVSSTNPNNYLISRSQYVLSYNRSKGISNWASWQLNKSWLGNLPRPPFQPDLSLPDGWYRVVSNDYTGSGFDRGHLVPAADRNRTEADSQFVFLMTNILPQAPDNNQGPWEDLESYCRRLARQGKELYIVAGGAGSGGTGSKGKRKTIAQGKVAVPASLWKVAVVLDQPGLGLRGINAETRVIAVIMPNQQGIKEASWTDFKTSVDAIEQLTGYDLLSKIPPSIQTILEAKVDQQAIQTELFIPEQPVSLSTR